MLRILLTSVCFQVSVAGPLRDLKTLREEGVLVSSAQALQPLALSIHLLSSIGDPIWGSNAEGHRRPRD